MLRRSYPSRLGPLLLVLLLVVGWGCGKKLAPIPPDSLVPGEVRQLTLRQDGEALRLTWLLPRVNVEGQPLTDIQGFRVLRHQDSLGTEGGCPPDLDLLAVIDLSYPQMGEVNGEVVSYRDDQLKPGKRYYYQVVGFSRSGHLGVPSAIVSHPWDILPQTPQGLEAHPGDRQVELRWLPVRHLADGRPLAESVTYQILRQSAGGPWTVINQTPVTGNTYMDITADNEVTYGYRVRSVRKLGADVLTSLDSALVYAKPVDMTPPAPVVNLVAVPTAKGIELRWESGREPDLAGYRVFRRSLAEPQFQLLTPQLLTQPYFVDAAISKGVIYFYYVIAVDDSRRANQSLPSEIISVTP